MTIFALTPTWNGKEYLSKLYPTLQRASNYTSNDLIWFIRDNNSDDGTEELIKSWDNELYVRYFKADNNKDNFSKCNNFLVDKVKEQEKVDLDKDYYLLLNNDITIEDPNSLNYMLDIFKDKDVGIVGAKLYYPGDSKLIQHFGVAMSPKNGNMPWHVFSGERDNQYTKNDKLFQAVTGAFLLIKCSCFDKLKNSKMNEDYNWAFDDIDMCLQISKNQNKKIVCSSKTKICHYESATLDKNKVNKLFMSSSINTFNRNWRNKYTLDYFDYINNPSFNIYK